MKTLFKTTYYTKRLFLWVFLSAFIFIVGCSSVPMASKNWPQQVLKTLSLREKIAQMMIYRMHLKYKDVTPEKWEEITRLLDGDGIGGIHLWSGDGSSSIAIMNEIQKRSRIPIIFDADIERGFGQRFPSGTDFPPMMAITATGNPENAYEVGKIVATESRAAGIHWNLSPVVDVNNNPLNPIINTRSFSENADIVSEFSKEYTKGLQDHGMIATAKHFPGHGDTCLDSHLCLPVVELEEARLREVELAPFRAAIAAGVTALMTAHVSYPALDDEYPATLSSRIVSTLLRDELCFDGLIMSDDMEMGAIVENYDPIEASVRAVAAGCDGLLLCGVDHGLQVSIIEGIIHAVEEGRLSEQRVEDALKRQRRVKEKFLRKDRLWRPPETNEISEVIGCAAHQEIADEMRRYQ